MPQANQSRKSRNIMKTKVEDVETQVRRALQCEASKCEASKYEASKYEALKC